MRVWFVMLMAAVCVGVVIGADPGPNECEIATNQLNATSRAMVKACYEMWLISEQRFDLRATITNNINGILREGLESFEGLESLDAVQPTDAAAEKSDYTFAPLGLGPWVVTVATCMSMAFLAAAVLTWCVELCDSSGKLQKHTRPEEKKKD
jgi:hypothetical protein